MLRSFATAVQGLGVIIGITAVVPWLVMPDEVDWGGLGFGTVVVVSLVMVVLGRLVLAATAVDRSTRRAGAASQVAVVVEGRRRRAR